MAADPTKAEAGAQREPPLLTCPACDVQFMGRPGDACPRCGAPVGERQGLPWQHRPGWRGFWGTIAAVHGEPRRVLKDVQQSEQIARDAALFVAYEAVLFLLWGTGICLVTGLLFMAAVIVACTVAGLVWLTVHVLLTTVILSTIATPEAPQRELRAGMLYCAGAAGIWLFLPFPPLNLLCFLLVLLCLTTVSLSRAGMTDLHAFGAQVISLVLQLGALIALAQL